MDTDEEGGGLQGKWTLTRELGGLQVKWTLTGVGGYMVGGH